MYYDKDLLKNKDKSIFRLILGVTFLVISVAWIIIKLTKNELIKPVDWFFSATFALNGLAYVFEGFGISIERFFGKAFVHIDNDSISIKLNVFKKEQKLYWQDIQSIYYKPYIFTFKMTNGTNVFPFTKFGNSCITEIKHMILKNADSKKIKYNLD